MRGAARSLEKPELGCAAERGRAGGCAEPGWILLCLAVPWQGPSGKDEGNQLLVPLCCFLEGHKGHCLEASSPQRGPCADTAGKPGGDSLQSYPPWLPCVMGIFGSALGGCSCAMNGLKLVVT